MPKLNGTLLRAARKRRGESVEDVAADVGRAPGTIRNIENGRSTASMDVAEALAARLGLTVEEITSSPDSLQVLPTPFAVGERISYNTAEAAAVTGMKPWTIQAAIRSGELKAALIGQAYVIPKTELELFVERAMQAAHEQKSA